MDTHKKTLKSQKTRPYLREHSTTIRVMGRGSENTMEEDPLFTPRDPISRSMVLLTCRSRQRKLQHAFSRWTAHTGVHHDYLKDVMTILSRPLPPTELRTELEVEVFFKWVLQDHSLDPTGIAYTLYMCKSKRRIVSLIQSARLEHFDPGEYIVLQNTAPQTEDGLFTVLTGFVDIVVLPPASEQLMQLHEARKHGSLEEVTEVLGKYGVLADRLEVGAGFGELSALTGVRRSASLVASRNNSRGVDVLVVTQPELISCLDSRRKLAGGAWQPPSAEVVDFLRQTGLIHKANIVDIMQAAACITKKTLPSGALLYKKGDKVNKVFILLSGEVFLDIGNYEDSMSIDGHPFQNLNVANCFCLGAGSILGDEGMVGYNRTYYASSIVLSESVVVFEITGFGIEFLGGRLGLEKFSALLYKSKPMHKEAYNIVLEEIVLHSTFNCLRKAISAQNPFRGLGRPKYESGPANGDTRGVLESQKLNHRKKAQRGSLSPPKISRRADKARVKTKRTEVSSSDAPSPQSSDGYQIMSNAAMHNLHYYHRAIKAKEESVMRQVARNNVFQELKKKKSVQSVKPKLTVDARDSDDVSTAYTNSSEFEDTEKYRRAMDSYLRQKDLEFDERIKQMEMDELSMIHSLHSKGNSSREDFFVQATNCAMGGFDEGSASSKCSPDQDSNSEDSDEEETKLEKYYKRLMIQQFTEASLGSVDKLPSTVAQTRDTRLFSRADSATKPVSQQTESERPSSRSYRPTLTFQLTSSSVEDSPATAEPSKQRPLSRQLSGGNGTSSAFFRVSTAHTVGASKPTAQKAAAARPLRPDSCPQPGRNDQKRARKGSIAIKMQSILEMLESSHEDDAPRPVLDKSRSSMGRALIRKATRELDEEEVTQQSSCDDREESFRKRRGAERARILQTWQEMSTKEPTQSHHLNGRRRAIETSEHRQSAPGTLAHPLGRPSSTPLTQDKRDLLRWKQYCSDLVLENKNGPRSSMPTLSSRGGATSFGAAMITNTVTDSRSKS